MMAEKKKSAASGKSLQVRSNTVVFLIPVRDAEIGHLFGEARCEMV